MSVERDPFFRECAFQVLLELSIRYLISSFEFPVIFALFLHCIISEMDDLVFEILELELSRGGPNISLIIREAFSQSINAGN